MTFSYCYKEHNYVPCADYDLLRRSRGIGASAMKEVHACCCDSAIVVGCGDDVRDMRTDEDRQILARRIRGVESLANGCRLQGKAQLKKKSSHLQSTRECSLLGRYWLL